MREFKCYPTRLEDMARGILKKLLRVSKDECSLRDFLVSTQWECGSFERLLRWKRRRRRVFLAWMDVGAFDRQLIYWQSDNNYTTNMWRILIRHSFYFIAFQLKFRKCSKSRWLAQQLRIPHGCTCAVEVKAFGWVLSKRCCCFVFGI